jgi:predicted MFS family arabinose efflux permease
VLIPADPEREAGRRFDVPGALTATSGTTLLVLALVRGPEAGWGSPEIIAALAAAVVLLAAFLAVERTSPDPLMPLRLFANRNLSVGATITFMALATLGSVLYFLTLYFQEVRGYGSLETGLAFLLPTAVIVFGSGIGGRLATRFGVRATLAVSLALAATGAVLIAAVMSSDVSYAALIPGLILLSLGDGIVYTVMFIAASTGVAERDQGVASGIASTGTQVGSAVGLAVLVAVAGIGAGAVTTDGLRAGILGAAAGLALTVLVALALDRGSQPHAQAAEAAGHA